MSHCIFPEDSVVVVFGGSGYIGRRIIEHVLKCSRTMVVCVDPSQEAVLLQPNEKLCRLKFGYAPETSQRDSESLTELLGTLDNLFGKVYVVNTVGYHPYKLGRPFQKCMDLWCEFVDTLARELSRMKHLECCLMISGEGCSENLKGVRTKLETTWLTTVTARRTPMIVMRLPYVYGPNCPLMNAFCFQSRGHCPGPCGFHETAMPMVFIDNVCSAVIDCLVHSRSMEWTAETFVVYDDTPNMSFADLAHETCVGFDKTDRRSDPFASFWIMETMFGDVLCEQYLRWLSWCPRPIGYTRDPPREPPTKVYPGWKPPFNFNRSIEVAGFINKTAMYLGAISHVDILRHMQPHVEHCFIKPVAEEEDTSEDIAGRLVAHAGNIVTTIAIVN
ncbi:hypothetical protein [Crucian carp herpesvirus]|uniref:ORF28 n=1 Tax=Cyprinid herpesvirus 2 TaxID=317878 RepID=A0A0Y0CQ85_CYHV2|nr:ORF28 [Cyprinid herpesvirus 2]APB92885.1 hypothetical protein [Crucian carp herpesvirus]